MLRLRGAGRRFGRRVVFSDLDLDVGAGGRVLLAGPNGAGKTTLLRCLSGTLTLSTGQATVAGHPVGSPDARRATDVCLAPEQGLYEQLTAHQNITLVARLRLPRRAVPAAVTGIEEELGIARYASLPVARCSAGMRARISIARSLVAAPALLLLDEPGRSLDEEGRRLLWQSIDRRTELTCVVASHHADDGRHCRQRLTLVAAG
ncbi:ATP-binding cassette domain-containing protein [Micromonospora sp. S-DT3-3-22]|uniref:ABC transporter ATP-binding protein n=1 Tax=Micromonospora sp. S-DT3-3-22 TaxID=2755359 RepID=UPI001E2BD736|nr:ATP-binding cassette domain-containing protein [Micromonospora sp. S-DT3-3-22]